MESQNYVINKATRSDALGQYVTEFVEDQLHVMRKLNKNLENGIFYNLAPTELEEISSQLLDNTPLSHRYECLMESDNIEIILNLLSKFMRTSRAEDGDAVLELMKKTIVDYYKEEACQLIEEEEKRHLFDDGDNYEKDDEYYIRKSSIRTVFEPVFTGR